MDCSDQRSAIESFVTHDGRIATHMRQVDWASTHLGDPGHWPVSLQHAVSFLLSSDLPTAILWGTHRALLYNDTWIPAMGHRHPRGLGKPAHEVWSAVWGRVSLQLEAVMEKASLLLLSDSEFPVRLDREKPWAFSLSPLRAPDGHIVAVLVQGQEVHPSALEPLPSHITLGRDRRMFDQAPGFITILRGPDHVFEFVNEAFRRSFGD